MNNPEGHDPTPGPWEYDDTAGRGKIRGPDGYSIASYVREADVPKITAAPNMYEALVYIDLLMASHECCSSDDGNECPFTEAGRRIVSDALEKARGNK